MNDSDVESWEERLSGRERVRHVVELLDGPTPVGKIADRATVSRTTADDELDRLASDDWVVETSVDGKKAYDLNPVRMLFDEVTDRIRDCSREELERELAELKQEEESLADEYDADSLDAFRETLADEDLSADELQERRNVIDTWEAVSTELSLVRHALRLYTDVVELSTPGNDSHSSLA